MEHDHSEGEDEFRILNTIQQEKRENHDRHVIIVSKRCLPMIQYCDLDPSKFQ